MIALCLVGMEIKIQSLSPDRTARRAVERILRIWVTYMHGEAKPAGYPRKACGGVTGYTSLDLENVAAYENLDRDLAEKADATINSLTPIEQCAIHHTYLHAVFRFNRERPHVVLERALIKIEIGLRKREVWLG